ncbi:hypothetical protein QCD60_14595 [Pokkaliibacter sp. MBI-7]|uniref:hypothetical protein n=1 Tax=Pokkaliibacter sp. MBI-7 TaxID=3040600 RepID=UPI00244981CB|nr:hypothetical protein [Pokkaliibacter sp. MBI-7]MDH2433799.1 hypothetical protein [Pokkaliibacter sp. MBI-7]
MRRHLLAMTAAAALLAGCSEHDLPYYQSHLDEAQTKVSECKDALKSAFVTRDKDALQNVAEDAECRAAEQAQHDYQRQLAEQERALREEEAKKQKAEQERQYTADYEQAKTDLPKLSDDDFFAYRKQCGNVIFAQPSAQCKAFAELEPARTEAAVVALITRFPKDQLITYKKDHCQGINFSESQCQLSEKAVDKQHDDQIALYLNNRDQLKTDFNSCNEQITQLKKERKYDESSELAHTYQCRLAMEAAQHLKVYGYGKPL